ncbi:ADP-ribose pyrophosphatase YjhB (NUDIX family) [Actinoplanes octamycinicus]|uniref:ADP-ribose pyrophosphatase YjhB (NUDIX family) n=1 Tax=Actinoplanes octamycinicus TaxID=135948 RepID=A0A7W7MBF1_9ACTN|nr:NUDIX domain-containing protein [Actinoplanes octamycinicus]MBB4743957.1 ADP-ribose pyrophosphatase YjhB (NUDIX family) [Actinoplanes octamycinicus]GIE58581.1 NUDIX hydrolase [Actinoplanes octamycinicus]
MPTPDFILELRKSIGTAPLWLSGVTAVVLHEGHVLLNRRSDTGRWALLHGILEPGEQPGVAVVREVLEETGVTVAVERLASVLSLPPTVCANGDQVQFLDLSFVCRMVGGQARVNDDESLAVAWFPLDKLPPITETDAFLLDTALQPREKPWFLTDLADDT